MYKSGVRVCIEKATALSSVWKNLNLYMMRQCLRGWLCLKLCFGTQSSSPSNKLRPDRLIWKKRVVKFLTTFICGVNGKLRSNKNIMATENGPDQTIPGDIYYTLIQPKALFREKRFFFPSSDSPNRSKVLRIEKTLRKTSKKLNQSYPLANTVLLNPKYNEEMRAPLFSWTLYQLRSIGPKNIGLGLFRRNKMVPVLMDVACGEWELPLMDVMR